MGFIIRLKLLTDFAAAVILFISLMHAFDQQIVAKVVLPVFNEFSSPQGQPRNKC